MAMGLSAIAEMFPNMIVAMAVCGIDRILPRRLPLHLFVV